MHLLLPFPDCSSLLDVWADVVSKVHVDDLVRINEAFRHKEISQLLFAHLLVQILYYESKVGRRNPLLIDLLDQVKLPLFQQCIEEKDNHDGNCVQDQHDAYLSGPVILRVFPATADRRGD